MNRDSLTKLRLDRRLLRRKGWIDPKEAEQALQALPDAAAKATTLGAVEETEAVAGDEGTPEPVA